MSFLTLPAGVADFSKAVISFWFRVPQASIDAATAAFTTYTDAPPPFNGIIPLVVMGRAGFLTPFRTTITHKEFESGASYDLFTTSPTGASLPTNPVVIGINCDPGYGRPVLYINFEIGQKATISHYQYELRDVAEPSTFTYVDVTNVVTDLTAAINGTNIYLIPAPSTADDPSGSGADTWHHALISLDLPTIETHGIALHATHTGNDADYVDSASQLFVALDDVNYTQFDLSNYFVSGSASNNMVVPEHAKTVAGREQAQGFSGDASSPALIPIGGIPRYVLSDPAIPSVGTPIGIPGSTEYVDKIYRVEMAEFQMWTGVTLDTAVEANRRAFVDAKGKPVAPTGTEDDPRSPGEKLLGKRPDILLHGNSNWIVGANTGSIGRDDTGNVIPGGQFMPIGGIEKYKPEPSLP